MQPGAVVEFTGKKLFKTVANNPQRQVVLEYTDYDARGDIICALDKAGQTVNSTAFSSVIWNHHASCVYGSTPSHCAGAFLDLSTFILKSSR